MIPTFLAGGTQRGLSLHFTDGAALCCGQARLASPHSPDHGQLQLAAVFQAWEKSFQEEFSSWLQETGACQAEGAGQGESLQAISAARPGLQLTGLSVTGQEQPSRGHSCYFVLAP